MKRLIFSALLIGAGTVVCSAADFQAPVRLKAGDSAIRVESPGFSAPGWADLKGDGTKYLLVGQFNDGKIRAYKHLGAGKFAPGEWLQADGAVAEIPGIS